MKQLLLAAMVSVVCSVIAVRWLGNEDTMGGHSGEHAQRATEQAAAGGQRQGNRGGEQAAAGGQRQGNRGGEQAAAAGQRHGNRGGEQAAAGGQRHGNRGGEQAASGGQRQGNRGNNQSETHSHGGQSSGGQGRGNNIAGFDPQNIEQSLAEMTAKLALNPTQQAAIREALVHFQSAIKPAREATMQARNSLTKLDFTSASYQANKTRLMASAADNYRAWIQVSVNTRETIYSALNPTQQSILFAAEAL